MKQATLYNFLLILMVSILYIACSKGSSSGNGDGSGSGGSGGGNPAAVFTVIPSGAQCMNAAIAGSYKQETALNSSNTVTIQVNVTQTGTWSLSTSRVNGISFSGAGTFSATGSQAVVLNGTGTPLYGGNYTMTISLNNFACNFTVPVTYKSITYIRGIKSVLLLYLNGSVDQPSNFQTDDEGGVSLSMTQLQAQGDTVEVRLVNADKGTTNAWDDFYFSQVVVSFSNVNDYGVGTNLSNVDTAGKLQVWIYRKDGSDIIPASNGKPPIKTIIQVPGKASNTPVYSGTIRMRYPYLNPWYNINGAFMVNMLSASKWKFGFFERRD